MMVEEKEKERETEKGKKTTSQKGITSYYEQVRAPANFPVSVLVV